MTGCRWLCLRECRVNRHEKQCDAIPREVIVAMSQGPGASFHPLLVTGKRGSAGRGKT